MKKIGIVTLYTGFNYGSALQAFASKKYYEKLGYESNILGYSDSLVKGRDIRIEKILIMFLRTFWRPSLFKKTFLTYQKSLNKEISQNSKNLFLRFYEEKLKVVKLNKTSMKEYGNKEEVKALICGSDQIWSATAVYVDPFYYLRFFPKNKRMAYAPSFGKSQVPYYNKKIIRKYIEDIPYLSTREIEGQSIIKELTGKDAAVLIDPTLLINKTEWSELAGEERIEKDNYILFYFLDIPSDKTLQNLKILSKELNLKIISIPNVSTLFKSEFEKICNIDTGPIEFLNLVKNATLICTDSFHGMLFSINFNKNFYIFERNYGVAQNQSGRIKSILNILDLEERFIKDEDLKNVEQDINWEKVNKNLEDQREKSKQYIMNSLNRIGESNNE